MGLLQLVSLGVVEGYHDVRTHVWTRARDHVLSPNRPLDLDLFDLDAIDGQSLQNMTAQPFCLVREAEEVLLVR